MSPDSSSNWTTYLGNNARTGYNAAETLITPLTAPKLGLRWSTRVGGNSTQPISTQALFNGWKVFWSAWDGAVRATSPSGMPIWMQQLGQTSVPACIPQPVGIANTGTLATAIIGGVARRALFVGGGDSAFYALDAPTGHILWRTLLGTPPQTFLWSSPAVYNGSVYEGVASFSDCPLVQGKLIQMDARTGTVQHVFAVVPNGCTGGSIWASPTIDEQTGRLYVTTGNRGDCSQNEPLAEAIIALRTSDLSIIGAWRIPDKQQVVDSDFGATPTLFTAPGGAGGAPRALIGASNKNGIFYAFDRSNLSAGPVWRTRIAAGGGCPACGAGPISPAAWDGTNLYAGGTRVSINGVKCSGSISALDPSTGRFRWRRCAGSVLGAITAAPGIVEAGAGQSVVILKASDGTLLFQYASPSQAVFIGAGSISRGLLLQGDSAGNLYVFGVHQ